MRVCAQLQDAVHSFCRNCFAGQGFLHSRPASKASMTATLSASLHIQCQLSSRGGGRRPPIRTTVKGCSPQQSTACCPHAYTAHPCSPAPASCLVLTQRNDARGAGRHAKSCSTHATPRSSSPFPLEERGACRIPDPHPEPAGRCSSCPGRVCSLCGCCGCAPSLTWVESRQGGSGWAQQQQSCLVRC